MLRLCGRTAVIRVRISSCQPGRFRNPKTIQGSGAGRVISADEEYEERVVSANAKIMQTRRDIKKILFLSIDLSDDSARDDVTYNFIMKEMVGLGRSGFDVTYFTDTYGDQHFVEQVRYTGRQFLDGISRLDVIAEWLQRPFLYIWSFLISPRRTAWITKCQLAVARLVKELEIEVIHTHFMAPDGSNCMIAAAKTNLPIVSTIRGAELCREPSLDYGAMRDRLFRYWSRRSASCVQVFTVPNRSMMSLLPALLKVNAERVRYVPNGVEELPMPEVTTSGETLHVIAVGRLTKLKNYGVLIDAMAEIGSTNVQLEIIGRGPMLELIRSKIKSYRLKNVNLLQEMKKEQCLARIAAADLLVHPSLSEGLPNVVLEALFLGKPCVVSDIPAHRDLIEDDYNGLLFDPSDHEDLANKISLILENRDQIKRMAQSCRSSVDNFTLDRKLASYAKIYSEIAGDASKAC